MKREDLNYQFVIDEITPPLYDLESMFWVVVSRDLVEKYGLKGEQAARKWIRSHANWRGYQIRKGSQALGVPVNVQNLFEYTDLPINNAFVPLWRKNFNWTPWNLKLKVSPGECVMYDRFKQHNIGFLGDVFCDELHQSFTTTYHPDAVVSVCRTMTKGDDHCLFQWVLPGDAKEPDKLELYPDENVKDDWQYDCEANIITCGLRKTMRWYAAQIHYLREICLEFFPEYGENEFRRLLTLWVEARADCIIDRKGDKVLNKDPKTLFENLDTPYTYTWDAQITEKEYGIDVEISYCPFAQTWSWLNSVDKMHPYCDMCYKTMIERLNPDCNVELLSCMTKGDSTCRIQIKE